MACNSVSISHQPNLIIRSRRRRALANSLFRLIASLASWPLVEGSVTNRLLPTHTYHSKRSTIPYKYVQGEDHLWYKVDGYTLYGSTICSQSCQPTSSVSEGDMEPMPTYDPSSDILDSLPAGWKPSEHATRTSLILAVSLALAVIICFFMTGCVIWRKGRLNGKQVDEEMRLRKRRVRDPDDAAASLQTESKMKQKSWDRAIARWKAKIHYLARQKRRRRVSSKNPSTQILRNPRQDQPVETHPALSPRPSQSTNRRLSLPTDESLLHRRVEPQSSSSRPRSSPGEHIMGSPKSVTLPPRPQSLNIPSPPTYQRATRSPSPVHIPYEYFHDTGHEPPPSPFAHSSTSHHALPDAPPYHAAHVAIDDKAVLAQMSNLASAPPTDHNDPVVEVSAPEWHEELDDEVDSLSANHCNSKTPSTHFPPPPTKPQIVSESCCDFTYSFADLDLVEPEPGPSAPPFEESCPGLPSPDMTPSAPPLGDL